MAALARVVMRQPRIATVVRHRHASLPFPWLKGGHLDLYSTNPLLRLGYRGTIGLKTGSTNAAGICLVAGVHPGAPTPRGVFFSSPHIRGAAGARFQTGP